MRPSSTAAWAIVAATVAGCGAVTASNIPQPPSSTPAIASPASSNTPAAVPATPTPARTPTPTPRATPTAAPKPTPSTLLDIQGSGTHNTDKFTTAGSDWQMVYTFDCSNFGSEGNFQVYIYQGDGNISELDGPNDLAVTGGNTESYHVGGTYYLEINSECSWTVKVIG